MSNRGFSSRLPEWQAVTRRRPCPVCGHHDWCQVAGAVSHCMRVSSGSIKTVESGGWIHRLQDAELRPVTPRQPAKRRRSDSELNDTWRPIAGRAHVDAALGSDRRLAELADLLGVSEASLRTLGVGYGDVGGRTCWTFPEKNAKGQVVGINRRLLGGSKRSARGGRRGLTYAVGWPTAVGPVYLVEGGSDVAAGLTLGLCVVGRPSNIGGVRDLVPLLGPLKHRRIVVLGERDRKLHATQPVYWGSRHDPKCRCCLVCYPGRAGAMRVAATLRKRLNRKVEWRMPPDRAKDLRAWLNSFGDTVPAIDMELLRAIR